MIDELMPEGVPINVEKICRKYWCIFEKGNHRLNGKELLGYARFRHDPEGDFGRVRRQQQVMQTLKKKWLILEQLLNYQKLQVF